MYNQYSRKRRKQLEHYFRALSSLGISGLLSNHYMRYEFQKYERFTRNFLMRSTLKSMNITGRDSLKEKIRWLLEDGLREEYKAFYNRLFFLSDEAKRQTVEAAKDDPDYGRLAVVYKTMRELPSAEIGAMGGGQAILLCRIGQAYGYLTKEEAWSLKIEAAAYLQSLYDNWSDYFVGFAVGSHFSISDHEYKRFADVRNQARSLLVSGTTAERLVWHQDLNPDLGAAQDTPKSLSV